MQENRKKWDEFTKKNPIVGKKNCPFCEENVTENEQKLIIKKTKYWEIRYNKYPYAGVKDHLLLFPKRHVELVKDLTLEEFSDLKSANEFINNYFKNRDYFSFLRETYSGRSIAHLHYHYLPGKIFSEDISNILKKQNLGKT